MNPILPEEISGVIDGMLDPERAAEVRAAIEHDSELKHQYERMLAVHLDITAYTGQLTNQLQVAVANCSVSAAEQPTFELRGIVVATLTMILVRLFCKLVPPPASFAVELLTLALMISAASGWLMHVSDRDAAKQLG